jgi:hypothetical protein
MRPNQVDGEGAKRNRELNLAGWDVMLGTQWNRFLPGEAVLADEPQRRDRPGRLGKQWGKDLKHGTQ